MRDIVAIHFPFTENASMAKPRPALALTQPTGEHNHVIVAFMTTQLDYSKSDSVLIDSHEQYFTQTGLKYSTAIVLHKLYTIETDLIKQKIGTLPKELESVLNHKLKELFGIK